MGEIRTPLPVKLFCGILTSLPQIVPEIRERLTAAFGEIESESNPFPFDLTHYYDTEMGAPISRLFFAFADLVAPAQIASIKKVTNGLEVSFAEMNQTVRRPANLDPGYLEESKIVLASTKNFYHRILLANGIYGEVTLHFSEGAWHPFPWSFPDFRSGRYDDFFTGLRRIYRSQIKRSLGNPSPGGS
jgi:hypothetical protein